MAAAASANNSTDYACMSANETDSAIMISNKIYFGASLLFTAVGLAGNSLSVTVFSSAPMRKVSSNVYLLTLAVSDALYLISVFLTKTLATMRCWYFVDYPIDLMNRSSIACVLLQYLSDLFSDFSTCLILAFTVERYVAVYLPTKFKYLCTVSRARITCSAIFVLVAIFIAPYHVMYVGILEGYNVCAMSPDHEAIFMILYAVESFLFRILPITVIAVLNVFIIFRVSKIKQKRKRMLSAKGDAQQPHQPHHHHEDSSLQLTIMLIVVSTTYIVLDIPVLAHFVIHKLTLSNVFDISNTSIVVSQNCTRVLFIAGYAVNFFLYTVSGTVFRQQLVSLLPACCCRRKKSYARKDTDAHGGGGGDKMSPLIEKR